MLVEAVARSIRYHLTNGREVRLVPGRPVDLPDIQARKLLAKAKGKVRLAEPANPDWLAGWRTLARITDGITADDPQFQPVMAAIEECDVAFLAGDWGRFQDGVRTVEQIVYRES